MKNIEKQAELFGLEDDDGFAVMNDDKRDGFKAGAEWMQKVLTRWCDPKKDLLEVRKEVLLKLRTGNGTTCYRVGWRLPTGRLVVTEAGLCAEIVAWREIHE